MVNNNESLVRVKHLALFSTIRALMEADQIRSETKFAEVYTSNDADDHTAYWFRVTITSDDAIFDSVRNQTGWIRADGHSRLQFKTEPDDPIHSFSFNDLNSSFQGLSNALTAYLDAVLSDDAHTSLSDNLID